MIGGGLGLLRSAAQRHDCFVAQRVCCAMTVVAATLQRSASLLSVELWSDRKN